MVTELEFRKVQEGFRKAGPEDVAPFLFCILFSRTSKLFNRLLSFVFEFSVRQKLREFARKIPGSFQDVPGKCTGACAGRGS